MSRKDKKKYHKSLKQQIHYKLVNMLDAGVGTSKRAAIKDGTSRQKIFSYNTYQTYYKHCKYFADYIAERHPECTTLRAARKYVNEWLQNGVDRGLSAYTIHTQAKAVGKLYDISPTDEDFFVAPQRRREDIKRSRGDAVRDKHFSQTNNDEFIKFCKGTGCRRNIMQKLEGKDLYTLDDIKAEIASMAGKELSYDESMHLSALRDAVDFFSDHEYFIHHRNDKGGRERYAPIIGKNKEQIVSRMKDTPPDEKVWQHVPGNADIHGYRSEYATQIYKMYARKIEDIPYDKVNHGSGFKYQSDVYCCKKDEKGKKLDRRAMLYASKALGHNRVEVVASNYIRGL